MLDRIIKSKNIVISTPSGYDRNDKDFKVMEESIREIINRTYNADPNTKFIHAKIPDEYTEYYAEYAIDAVQMLMENFRGWLAEISPDHFIFAGGMRRRMRRIFQMKI